MNTLLVSSNKLDKIQQCSELFRYLYVKELTGFTKPVYQDEGDLFHKLLELYYKEKRDGRIPNIDNIIELGRNHATSLNIPAEELEENFRLFREYILYYANDAWKIEEVEVPFATEIYSSEEENIRIILEGKIDLIATDERTKVPLVIDHKRVSRNYTPYDRDNQKMAYCLASGRRDFIINQVGDQKSYPVDKRLQRYYFNIGDHQIEEFRMNVIAWAMEMIHVIDNDSKGLFIKRNYNSCSRFNMKCQFYDVCNTTEDNRLYKLEQAFKPKINFDLFEVKK